MIAELFLILDLLPDTVQPNGTPKSPAVKPTKGSTANLAAGLFGIGPITEIKQPVAITITPQQAATAYLQAATGRPEKIGTGGRF
jgi:hypothetical protein|tara:strand:+ start:255 stop:509 length:255 start_codon:yes stop_codon:yes gene_type:complete